MSLLILGSLLSGFGWAIVIVACVFGIVALYADELSNAIAFRVDYDDLDVNEIVAIEEARAELARKARERADKARQAAAAARFEALSARAFYVPSWDGPWESVALDRLREASIGDLLNFPGIGPARARRIVDAGDSLNLSALRKICTAPVAGLVMRTV